MIEYKRDIEVLRDTIASAVQPIEGAVLAPAGYQLIATEQFGDIPTRLRGTYHAGSLADFAKYLDAYADESESVVFLSPDRVSARIDHGSMATPGWGDHKAVFEPEKTPEYSALLSLVASGTKSQSEMIDWIVDWKQSLEIGVNDPEEEWNDMTFIQALSALRKLSTHAHRAVDQEAGTLHRAKSVLESAAITSAPPKTLRVTCAPYDLLPPRQFLVRLIYKPTDPIVIKASIVGAAMHQKEIGEQFREEVTNHVKRVPVYLGRF